MLRCRAPHKIQDFPPNILVRKFFQKRTVSTDFRGNRPKIYRSCLFTEHLLPRKLGGNACILRGGGFKTFIQKQTFNFLTFSKKSSILLRTVYQPIPQIEENMEWLDKIEAMLSIIASTFTGTTILAGDTNINVSEPSTPQKRYQEILENFNLVQHNNLPTRKGSKIIDHIITNIPNKTRMTVPIN